MLNDEQRGRVRKAISVLKLKPHGESVAIMANATSSVADIENEVLRFARGWKIGVSTDPQADRVLVTHVEWTTRTPGQFVWMDSMQIGEERLFVCPPDRHTAVRMAASQRSRGAKRFSCTRVGDAIKVRRIALDAPAVPEQRAEPLRGRPRGPMDPFGLGRLASVNWIRFERPTIHALRLRVREAMVLNKWLLTTMSDRDGSITVYRLDNLQGVTDAGAQGAPVADQVPEGPLHGATPAST